MSGLDENSNVFGDGEGSMPTETAFPLPQHEGIDEDNLLDVLGIHNSYSSGQIAVLKVAPRITSVMSILGCAWIVAEVWYFSNKRFYVYHKIVSAMALYCIFVSAWYFVADWAWTGSDAACRTQGYFVQLSLAPLLYFAMLFLYYMLVISYAFPEQLLTRNKSKTFRAFPLTWQQIFHILPFAVSVATACASLALDLFHPSSFNPWCWIEAPAMNDVDDAIPPNRFPAFQWGFYLGPAWVAFGAMCIAFFSVIRGVQAQEKRMKKYVTASTIRRSKHGEASSKSSNPANAVSSSSIIGADPINSTNTGNGHIISNHSDTNDANIPNDFSDEGVIDASIAYGRYGNPSKSCLARLRAFFLRKDQQAREYWEHRPRTRQVAVQCGCYVGAFFWSTIFLSVNQIFAWRNQGNPDALNPFVLVLLQAIYQPLLGFFILLAYRRPFYMRMRREGMCRRKALIASAKWNQNPVDPPGVRRVSNSLGKGRRRKKLSPEEKDRRRKEKAEAKAQKQRLREQQRPSQWQSEPVMNFSSIRGSSRHLRDSFLELLGKHGNKEFTFSREDIPLETVDEDPSKILDASSNGGLKHDRDEDKTGNNTQSTSGTAETYGNPASPKDGGDSFSTLDTRRTSALTKDDSSRRFELQQANSLKLNDLMHESRSDDDANSDASISLEELVGDADEEESKEGDGGEDSIEEDESYEEGTDGGDEESQVSGAFSPFGRGQLKGDFELIKQSSDRYKDLVFMDIIPEAEGDIEDRWRIIETKVKRYKKTKHDKHKFNMSVPVISERNFEPIDLVNNHITPDDNGAQTRSDTKGRNQRFAWAKNPLFKVSGRKEMKASTSKQPKKTPPSSPRNSGDTGKSLPNRTSSGGYFSRDTTPKADTKFWAKLERERSRQATLQAISSRRIRSVQSAEEDELIKMVGSVEKNEQSNDRHDFDPSSSNPLLDAGVDFNTHYAYEDIPLAAQGSGISNRLKKDLPPTYVAKRVSSSEFSARTDGSEILESSNELTSRSTGSSIRTIKRSNRQQRSSADRAQRLSNTSSGVSSGGVSSEEVSLVSDGPISDDDFLSGSGSDSDDDDPDAKEESGSEKKKRSETQQQTFSRTIRESLEELQRVSERSIEGELGESASSLMLDPSSTHTEHA